MFETHNSTDSEHYKYDIEEGYDSPALQVRDRQHALHKALENIAQLQQSLTFMIKYNEQLKEENERLKNSQQKSTGLLNKQLNIRDKELQKLKKEHFEVVDLLQELKQVLNVKEQELKNVQDQNKRLHKIVNEQKLTIHSLEDEAMNSKIYEASSYFSNNCEQYQHAINELEKEINDLQYQLKRSQQQLDKERQRVGKIEKENGEFKKWMASLVGVNKVVDGSEKIVMKEISNRLLN